MNTAFLEQCNVVHVFLFRSIHLDRAVDLARKKPAGDEADGS
jgi:hypothetical protein